MVQAYDGLQRDPAPFGKSSAEGWPQRKLSVPGVAD